MNLYRENLILGFLLLFFGLYAHLYRAAFVGDVQILVHKQFVFNLQDSQLSQQAWKLLTAQATWLMEFLTFARYPLSL